MSLKEEIQEADASSSFSLLCINLRIWTATREAIVHDVGINVETVRPDFTHQCVQIPDNMQLERG